MSWPDYLSGVFLGGFLGLGLGCWLSDWSFRRTIREKADTGIRLESGGRLFTVHSAEDAE